MCTRSVKGIWYERVKLNSRSVFNHCMRVVKELVLINWRITEVLQSTI